MAETMTKQRREEFLKVQSEQFNLPEDLRVPHYYDQFGKLKAYTQEEIEAHRKKMEVPIPTGVDTETEPTDQSTESVDFKIHPDIQDEILGVEKKKTKAKEDDKAFDVASQINQI